MADRPPRRSVADLTTIVNDLGAHGIQCRSLTEAIDTTTVGGELVFHIFTAVAQMQRRLISERTGASLVAARARGRAGGRPTVMTAGRLTAAQAMRARGMTLNQIAATLGVGRSSLVRALAQAPATPAAPEDATIPDGQTVLQLPEPAAHPAEPAPVSAAQLAALPETSCWGEQVAAARMSSRRSTGPLGTHLPARPALARLTAWRSSTPTSAGSVSRSSSHSPDLAIASSMNTPQPCWLPRTPDLTRTNGPYKPSVPCSACGRRGCEDLPP